MQTEKNNITLHHGGRDCMWEPIILGPKHVARF